MNRKAKESLIAGILFFLGGAIFLLGSAVGEHILFMPIGFCCFILSIVFFSQYNNSGKDKDDKNEK